MNRKREKKDEIKGLLTETLMKAADDVRLGHYEDAIWYMGMAYGLLVALQKGQGVGKGEG